MRSVTAGCKPAKQERHRPNRRTCAQRWHNGDLTTELSLQSGAHFFRPHLPQVLRRCQFFNILKWKPSSRHSPVHFGNFPRSRPAPTETETLNRRHQEPHYPVPHPRVLSLSLVNIHTLPNCFTSQLLDDGWLTWWFGWHDGGTNHDSRQ